MLWLTRRVANALRLEPADERQHGLGLLDAQRGRGLVHDDHAAARRRAARATATAWRWPPDRAPAFEVTGGIRSPRRVDAPSTSRRIRRLSIRRTGRNQPAEPCSSRPRYMFSAMLSVGTRARFWNTVSIPASRMVRTPPSVHGLPSSRISPESGLAALPGDDRDRGSLPGPVVAENQAQYLTAVQGDRDTQERDDRPVPLGDVRDLQRGRLAAVAGWRDGSVQPCPRRRSVHARPRCGQPVLDQMKPESQVRAAADRPRERRSCRSRAPGPQAVSATGTRSSRWYSTSRAAATTSAAPTARSAT